MKSAEAGRSLTGVFKSSSCASVIGGTMRFGRPGMGLSNGMKTNTSLSGTASSTSSTGYSCFDESSASSDC